MADEPIMTDVNINGQTEKFADPQHFTGSNNEGRAKTGEKNPFPTKDDKVLAKLEEIDGRLSKIESGDTTLNTQLTGRAVEVIRNYSMVVTNPGNHSAGDVFRRGNDVPALDVSNYRNIMITLLNEGEGEISMYSKLRIYSSSGNVSGDGGGTKYVISDTQIPRIPEGGRLVLTGLEGLKESEGFFYTPILNLPIVELVVSTIISNINQSATIQIIGESRQKNKGDN